MKIFRAPLLSTTSSSVRFLPAAVLLILISVVLSVFSISAMAVDRTKFRTCEQTSFCRRHRQSQEETEKDRKGQTQYKVLFNTLKFHSIHSNAKEEDSEKVGGPKDAGKQPQDGGVWTSLQRRLLGNSGAQEGDESNKKKANVITPTLTGRLQSRKTIPTSGDDDVYYLDLSITALQNEMIRVQVTEVYDASDVKNGKPRRVTYDDLVLQQSTPILHAHHVEWIQHPNSSRDSKSHQLFVKILKQRKVPEGDFNKYTALLYGDDNASSEADSNDKQMFLLIQMEPHFVVSLYRTSNIMIGPILELNTEQLMHYEIQRTKSNNDSKKVDTAAKGTTDDATTTDEDKHGGKEIVGYWEDGLAIYADGTREEKKKVEEEHEVDEHHRKLSEESENGNDEEGMWEETFGSHVDTKPYGPMSVGVDITFPNSQHVYGIPEHASSAVLQTTMTASSTGSSSSSSSYYKEPYRLYNLDVFEYELDETMALYGAVPLMISQSMTTGTSGVFYFNPTETFIDISRDDTTKTTSTTRTHWISESGILDLFLLPGPDPHTFYQQYSILTGVTPLPTMFSLGYHQCRWNYKDETDVATVHAKFEELDYPYDVLWLDIEHTNGKRYFTWDNNLFPNPKIMQQNLANHGRYMVTIIDPHMKRDDNYYIHKEATAKGLYIKDKDGKNDYDGWCWPGSSSYLDFTAEHVRSWWADQFHYNKYIGSTPSLFTWNDMNEPSVFNGPEVSMQKDLRNLNGEEHREWHNLYGMLFHRSTTEGQIRRNQPDMDIRPFVLSRSFFAGSQRYGSIWTGDNAAEWSHLQIAAPMLLSLNTAALSFVGADVGGFFGNPEAELFTRWMQAGAYQPFFRGHAHHDSKRREPWMFGEETLVRLRNAAMKRYALLPYWYTTFYEAEATGMPVMRMMWMEYPRTEELFGLDDQYLIGADLLVKPITTENTDETTIVFPSEHFWYDVETMQKVLTSTKVEVNQVVSKVVSANIDTIPVYQRGGSILPRKLRLRRSSTMMKTDPYTLYIALDNNNQANGTLHMDDEISFGYKKRGEYADASFSANLNSNGAISNVVIVGSGWTNGSQISMSQLAQERMIERIIVLGLGDAPSKLIVDDQDKRNRSLDFSYDSSSKVLVIRKPELSAVNAWTISYIV